MGRQQGGGSRATGEGEVSNGCDPREEVGSRDTKLSHFLRAPRNLGFYLKSIGNYHKLKKKKTTPQNLSRQMVCKANDKCVKIVITGLFAD